MMNVQHLPNEHRFIIQYEGEEAVLAYRLMNYNAHGEASAINFTSTFVPPKFRGQGLAEKLVRAGLQWAKTQGYELHASCWYVAKFIR